MKYPVVYSYKKAATRELELSIESLKNIAEWNGKVFIIGDKPNLKADYTYLPIKYTWGRGVKSNDEICAYLTAADFLDEFIIMADDIYCFGVRKLSGDREPWSLEYQNRGTLEEHIASRKFNDNYTRLLKTTNDFLLDNGRSNLSFELHIPFLVRSEQLNDAAEIIKVTKPMLVRSIIGNWFDIPSKLSIDPKNQVVTDETVIYSSQDRTFNYEKVREYLK